LYKNSKRKLYFILAFYLINSCLPLLSLASSPGKISEDGKRDVIVGELLGRIDPDDLEQLIQTNYYPTIGKDKDIVYRLEEKTSTEVIYRIEYPPFWTTGHPERIVFKFFDSEQSLAAAIITDKVDFAITESNKIAQEIHDATGAIFIHFRFKKPHFVKMLAYNNGHFILRNKNVRKALTYSIDREYIKQNILNTQANFADGPISDDSEFHVSTLEEYKFNQKKAFQLLRADNWIDENGDGIIEKKTMPLRINLAHERGVLLEEQIARRIKIDWNKLGVDVIRTPMTKDEMKANLAGKDYDVILMNYQFQDNIKSFSDNFVSNSQNNFLAYDSRTTDKYIRTYKNMDPSTSQKVMFQAIQSQINKDHPAAFLFFLWLERFFVNRAKFENYATKKKELLPFTEWKFKN
jgi:peptide/nickel transport system substrate-binding protein